jgi:hypothetical protein
MTNLKNLQKEALLKITETINYAIEHELTNSQEFINFLDAVNELSITY